MSKVGRQVLFFKILSSKGFTIHVHQPRQNGHLRPPDVLVDHGSGLKCEYSAMPEFAAMKQSHLFQPGRSGNPAGKPPGTRSKAVAELDRLGAEGAKQVLEAVLRAAQQGDMVAAGIILKGCWPESRGRPVRLKLPSIATAADVVKASAAGELLLTQ